MRRRSISGNPFAISVSPFHEAELTRGLAPKLGVSLACLLLLSTVGLLRLGCALPRRLARLLEAKLLRLLLGDGPLAVPVERKRLRYRETDRFVEERAKIPLSVSSDRIAVTAMRCASILDELGKRRKGRISRRGGSQIVEVYPAAALVLWSDEANDLRFEPKGYKGSGGKKKREILVQPLQGASPWLNWKDIAATCIKSDDALDALLSALVARAAALGLTALPQQELGAQADREGWIHLPPRTSLDALTGKSG